MSIDRLKLRLLAALGVSLASSMLHAKAVPATESTADRPYLSAGAPPVAVQLGAAGDHRILGFIGAAGEQALIDIGGLRAADPCAIDLTVSDDSGQVVARQACAGAQAHVPVMLSADGTYWARFDARSADVGAFSVALGSPVRERAAPGGNGCKLSGLPLDHVKKDAWDTSCDSVSFSGHYAQYYTIDIPVDQVVTVGLASSTNAYLVLHLGKGPNGPVVSSDDNSGIGTNSRILRTLKAGSYTIEATTASAGQGGDFTVSARTDIAPCFEPLLLNKVQDGKWTSACSSAAYADDHLVRYFTLSVPADEMVTLSLNSSTNTFLVLRQGPTQLSPILATNDNSGMGTNSMIVRTLPAGVYTLEATTASAGQGGKFTISAATDDHPCFSNLKLDATAASEWITRCESVYFDDHYARYFTFKVPKQEVVTISLSSSTNTFLVLREGPTRLSPVLATDDNSGMGTDARIATSLKPGTYTIEATTASAGQGGTFDLAARTNTTPCFAPLPLDTDTPDQWVAQCTSVSFDDHYSKYYTLVVPSDQLVTLSLSSTTNPYLVLREGPDQFGAVIAQDDNSGMGTDARIVTVLAAGTYTVEATTASAGQGGTFDLAARTQSLPCVNPIALDTPLPSQWIAQCTSTSFDDHFSLYYTLEVPRQETVTISLQSGTNSYLVLREGNQLGAVVAQDDNSGMGTDARIAMPLAAGTYSIEATTASAGQGGTFTLAARTNSAPCFASIALGGQLSDSWTTDCTSVSFDDHFAKYYTLKVPKKQTVSILLTSTTNAYLVLREGDQLGAFVAEDDNSGGGTNAKILRTLGAGTYTIEATTASAGQGGDFQLTLGSQ